MKKAVAFFLAVVMMISLAACERSDTGKKQSSNEIIADNPGNSDEKEAPDDAEPSVSDGKVNKYKIYELHRADNDKITIEMWYRSGSDVIAQISGTCYVPAGSQGYDSMLADNIAFEQKVNEAALSEDVMYFSYDEITLENGYVQNVFTFKELDGDNSQSVAMIGEFLGLPISDGYFKLSDCENYLQQSGLKLTSEH